MCASGGDTRWCVRVLRFTEKDQLFKWRYPTEGENNSVQVLLCVLESVVDIKGYAFAECSSLSGVIYRGNTELNDTTVFSSEMSSGLEAVWD